MDDERFDGMARVLALRISRRGATALFALLPPLALATREDSAAKKRKKKRRARCKTLRQSCAGGACCGSLGCGDNGCAGGAVCYQRQGGGCSGDCDCGGDLRCSERQGDTCQDCSYPETPCTYTAECCLKDSICGYNGCVLEPTCCQWEIGSFCYDDCDCCEELGCFGNTCLPLLAADGVTPRARRASEGEAAGPRPAKWSKGEAPGKRGGDHQRTGEAGDGWRSL
jgi:hypothetical protein